VKGENKELLQAVYIQDKRHDPLLEGTLLVLKTYGKNQPNCENEKHKV